MHNYQKNEVIVVLICLLIFPAFAQNDTTKIKPIKINSNKVQISQPSNFISKGYLLDTVYNPGVNYSKPTNTENLYWDYKINTNKNLEESNQTTQLSGRKRQISDFGWGFALSYRYQWYDNEVMNYFKKVSMFSMDLDIFIQKWAITGNASYGGGMLYDSLEVLDFAWQPYTKLSTATYGVFLGYALKDDRVIKILPFAGLQMMKIKLKPDYYMVSPVGLENTISTQWLPSIGVNMEIKNNHYSNRGKYFVGFGLRLGYSYTLLNFTEIDGFMHQLTIGLDWCWRKVSYKKQ